MPSRNTFSSLLWRAALANVALAWLPQAFSQTTAARPTNAPPPVYMRVTHPDSNTVQLEIALKQFVPARGEGPAVWLVAASHIAESNYFAALQRHLDAQGRVLFEGIRERPGVPAFGQEDTLDVSEGSLQFTLAESLGLAFQLQAINYRRPHFRNSDLSLPELQKLMLEGLQGAAARESAAQLALLMQLMDGSSFLGAVANFAVRLLGTSPKLQALARLTLIETIGQIEGDMAQMRGLPPEFQKLMEVLIRSRNTAVLTDLKAELKKRPAPASVAIFYGAGHMPDLEARLAKELNYQPRETNWLTAITVKPAEAGVTEAEMQFVRGLVKWQMQELQKQPEAPRKR
jgi:hypothetical protein